MSYVKSPPSPTPIPPRPEANCAAILAAIAAAAAAASEADLLPAATPPGVGVSFEASREADAGAPSLVGLASVRATLLAGSRGASSEPGGPGWSHFRLPDLGVEASGVDMMGGFELLWFIGQDKGRKYSQEKETRLKRGKDNSTAKLCGFPSTANDLSFVGVSAKMACLRSAFIQRLFASWCAGKRKTTE